MREPSKPVERGILVFAIWATLGVLGLGIVLEGFSRDSVRLAAEYEPLRQMLVRAELGWGQDVYDGQDRRDERFFTGLGFDYVFTPRVRAVFDWRHEQRSSEVAGDATRNLVRLGLTAGY